MNIREEETTMNIQDLFNERNEQNKRITELVLKLEKQKEVLDKISDNIDLELLKTRRNDDYNKGFFDGVMSIKTTLEKLLEEIYE